MPRTRNPAKSLVMKTRSGKTIGATAARAPARGPTTRAAANVQTKLAQPVAAVTGRKAPTCKHCGKPRAGHGKKCVDGYSKAKELEEMLDKADALAQGVAQAEANLLRERIDEEVAKVVEGMDSSVSIEDVVMTLAPQIADATGTTLSMQELVDALPALITTDDDDEAPAANVMNLDAGNTPAANVATQATPRASVDDVNMKEAAGDAAAPTTITSELPDAKAAGALLNGWKSTPAGDAPMELERNSSKKAPYPSQIERAKRTPRLFQAMAQKGDVLANRVDGWAFCLFVPKNGRGEMRTWHSDQVEAEVPALPGRMRALAFEALEPIRRQRLAEVAKVDEARRKELKRWQKEAANAQSEVASLRAQLDEAVKELRLEKAMKALA
ncbi:hypothetical protein AURDEDRAFT_165769 [Auricularia subglabra TFB-10046 SS5]|nr:hypothetical protein AURDEDRAFT_165769 [Auricularia subglabra TFB-10046 SS5]